MCKLAISSSVPVYTMTKPFSLRFLLFVLCLGTLPLALRSQPMQAMSSGEIQLALKKLNVLGTALYVAAHPDDENTAMLAYLAKDRLVRTGYLSITRGDGGQNLIGPEQAELMGLIRTQELLQARRIDGAEQFFTRANDFGFSKSTDEALQIWGKDKVLADVVWVIRKFQPDVIITRFPPNSQAGHGHHSASAVLAEEAFKVAADPKRFPEQLKFVKPWQAKRVVWNSYKPNFTGGPPDSSKSYIPIEIGGYNPLLGKSYTEVAAESRSMHKSQGFGSAKSRGSRLDYLTHTAGETAKKDVFDGVNLTWSRSKGGEELEKLFDQAYREFRPENPALTVPILLEAYRKMQAAPLADQEWVVRKREEVVNLIVACTGLWYEANAAGYVASPGASVKVTVNVVKRSDLPAQLEKISFVEATKDTVANIKLENNKAVNLPFTVTLAANTPLTQPYWLANPHEKGMYTVNDLQLIGKPEKAPHFAANLTFSLNGQQFVFQAPVTFKRTDPVEGEVYRPFEIRPEVSANLAEKVYVFADQQPKEVAVLIKSALPGATGEASLQVPKGWKVEPQLIPFNLKNALDEQTLRFKVTAPGEASEASLKVLLKTKNGTYSDGIRTVDYKHIPAQTLYPPAEARLVKLDVKIKGIQIGYIAGAGDEVPAALKQIGYRVNVLTVAELSRDLSGFDAIVVGVRAYNTDERLKYFRQELLDYVSAGGNLVVQYQVDRNLVTNEIGPFPFKLSRERVTMEEAPITFLKPTHPILNTPNKITSRDFDGWIQERGLYFAETWDKSYEPILSSHDPGEKPKEGGLLLARYGKGTFIYTGYAFFRQLPAGVPGAYRLFANLISAGQTSANGESAGKAAGAEGK
jgi:LmbE family N-acetylglucosaminyl deacetylase